MRIPGVSVDFRLLTLLVGLAVALTGAGSSRAQAPDCFEEPGTAGDTAAVSGAVSASPQQQTGNEMPEDSGDKPATNDSPGAEESDQGGRGRTADTEPLQIKIYTPLPHGPSPAVEPQPPAAVIEVPVEAAPATTRVSLFYRHFRLEHRTANHSSPDAIVYIPRGFNPTEPVRLVIYNHGLTETVDDAFKNAGIKKQMDKAPPNSVLVMPEWAENPKEFSQKAGPFHQPGFFRAMLQEIFQRTSALKGLTLDKFGSIELTTYSGGYRATMTQIYRNGLERKVTSVTLLDSLYDNTGFDQWIQENIRQLAARKKRFQNFFFDTKNYSQQQARRVEQMLARAGLPRRAMIADYGSPGSIMTPETIARHGIVFKYSEVQRGTRSRHASITDIYLGQIMRAIALSEEGKSLAAAGDSGE